MDGNLIGCIHLIVLSMAILAFTLGVGGVMELVRWLRTR